MHIEKTECAEGMQPITGAEREAAVNTNLYMPDEEYIKEWEKAAEGTYPLFDAVDLYNYKHLQVYLYQTFGGRIPVLFLTDRAEFELLIRDVLYKGQAKTIPPAVGGIAVNGWKGSNGTRHKVLLLSDGYYSAVTPESMNLSSEEWKAKSFLIRRAHECTHYYTLRAFGFMNSSLKDELIADAIGLIEAFGTYDAQKFFTFMGMENYPAYRESGRLKNYLKKESADPQLFKEAQDRLYKAALELEEYIGKHPEFIHDEAGKRELINTLAAIDEAVLFGGDFASHIVWRYGDKNNSKL